MQHTYSISGITCSSCEQKIKTAFFTLPDVEAIDIDRAASTISITMGKHVPTSAFQAALAPFQGKYQITALQSEAVMEVKPSWLTTYWPILLIFGFITLVTLSIQIAQGSWSTMQFMAQFMAGFFLVFSFFKFLDIKGFATSYAMYDIVAKRIPSYGYVYPFLELGLGLAFLTGFRPQATAWFSLVLMAVSLSGVVLSVLRKQAIQCACLGTVFQLPMSTVTIIEDSLMLAMSAAMLLS